MEQYYNKSFNENLAFNIHPLKQIENSIKRSLNSKKLCPLQVCFPVGFEQVIYLTIYRAMQQACYLNLVFL